MKWIRKNYEIETVEHDADLRAFEVRQGGAIHTIYPADEENMQSIIRSLDAGDCVDGWEDGMGGTISIQ